MELRKTAPAKVAQYYALMSWKSMDSESAKKLIDEKSYEELNELTNANDLIMQAKSAFEKHLIYGDTEIDIGHFKGDVPFDQMYFYGVGDKVIMNFDSEEDLCECVVKVANLLYNETSGSKLQNNLISFEEMSKYLMIISSIITVLGYSIGSMQELANGKFEPSSEIEKAYNRYSEKFKDSADI